MVILTESRRTQPRVHERRETQAFGGPYGVQLSRAGVT